MEQRELQSESYRGRASLTRLHNHDDDVGGSGSGGNDGEDDD